MGVVNVTPDSFSDGGRHDRVDAAVSHALAMQDAGADIIDVGGESTRPGASPVAAQEEEARVLPVLDALHDAGVNAALSVDTRRPPVAEGALARGVDIINDVSGLRDAAMARVVAAADVPVVLMHMRGEPETMQRGVHYGDVVGEVAAQLRGLRDAAVARGVSARRILLDPGLGFGKRTGEGVEDNAALLSGLPQVVGLGHPVVVGASRKRFLGSLTGRDVDDRLAASLAAAVAAAWGGADVIRVHDVGPTVDALHVAAAIDPSAWRARAPRN